MSHFVAYILQFQEIIVYKIPPGGGGSIASLRSIVKSEKTHPLNVLMVHYRCCNSLPHRIGLPFTCRYVQVCIWVDVMIADCKIYCVSSYDQP